MSTYRVTVQANRSPRFYGTPDYDRGESRRFSFRVNASDADSARRSIGNRPVTDPSDGAWFDEWRILDTRKV